MSELKLPSNEIAQPASEQPTIEETQRPWGKFRQYAHNARCTVSIMNVTAGQRLSLQSHHNRTELWIVLDEGCEIQIAETVYYPSVGDEFWIPNDTPHRLAGRRANVRVLEVAFGDWQQEDITRYADDYGRQ